MEAMKQYGRMFRLNTWFRFTDQFYGLGTPVKPLKKLVQSGLLGWPLKVTISAHTGFNWKFFLGRKRISRTATGSGRVGLRHVARPGSLQAL